MTQVPLLLFLIVNVARLRLLVVKVTVAFLEPHEQVLIRSHDLARGIRVRTRGSSV